MRIAELEARGTRGVKRTREGGDGVEGVDGVDGGEGGEGEGFAQPFFPIAAQVSGKEAQLERARQLSARAVLLNVEAADNATHAQLAETEVEKADLCAQLDAAKVKAEEAYKRCQEAKLKDAHNEALLASSEALKRASAAKWAEARSDLAREYDQSIIAWAKLSECDAKIARLRSAVKEASDARAFVSEHCSDATRNTDAAARIRGDLAACCRLASLLPAPPTRPPLLERSQSQQRAAEKQLFKVLGLVGGLGFWEAWRLPQVCRELRFAFSGGGAPADMIKLGLEARCLVQGEIGARSVAQWRRDDDASQRL